MANDPRYLVLGRGEAYKQPLERHAPRRPPPHLHRSYDAARASLLPQITSVVGQIARLPVSVRLDEAVVELQLHPKYLAKSHEPGELLRQAGLHIRGSGMWLAPARPSERDSAAAGRRGAQPVPVAARTLFVSGTDSAIESMQRIVKRESPAQLLQENVIKIEHIRLPPASERLAISKGELRKTGAAVELVLYAWESRRRRVAVERIRDILRRHDVEDEDVLVRQYDDGPTFIAAKIDDADALDEIEELNFLRAARALPRVELTRQAVGARVAAPPAPRSVRQPVGRIAVFDAGFDRSVPQLDPFVEYRELTSKPAFKKGTQHGIAVASAAVFGHVRPGSTLEPPAVTLRFYRVLPDKRDDALELYGVIDALESQVPKLNDAKVINLSFGPTGPIDTTRVPTRFTYAIDRLAYEHDKLFFAAVGNWGEKPQKDLRRIQPPSDAANVVAVGAFAVDPFAKGRRVASYSCEGPGRSGCLVRPDLVAFGGSADAPFYVLDETGHLVGTMGTSFATPLAAALTAELFARVQSNLSAQAGRALLIHATKPLRGEAHAGWGVLPESVEEILACNATRVSVLYEGTLSPRTQWKLPFLLPTGFDPGGNLEMEWTIVFAPEVDQGSVTEYTLGGLDVQLRPHKNIYRFSKREVREPRILDVVAEKAEADRLISEGWSKGPLPVSDSRRGRLEQTLRATEAKWDTVVRKRVSKQRQGILDPFLTVSFFGRGAWDKTAPEIQARFAAVLTVAVSARNYHGDLYQQVVQSFAKLQPLTLQAHTRVRV